MPSPRSFSLVVARHRLHIRLVRLERARGIGKVQVAQDAEIAARVVITRVSGERRFVAVAGLSEAARLAIDDAEFVVDHRVLGIELECLQQPLLGGFEIALAMQRDAEVDLRSADARSALDDGLENRDALFDVAGTQ